MEEPTQQERPQLLPVNADGIPESLKQRPQWVLCRMVARAGHWTKEPWQTNGRHASSTNPATWTTADAVLAGYHAGKSDGIGYVFASGDPFVGVDMDHVVTNGVVEPEAQQIIDDFASYAELSPSGTGVHIIVEGALPTTRTGARRGALEVYQSGRYFTVTGHRLPGVPAEPVRNDLALARLWKQRIERPTEPPPGPGPGPTVGGMSDGEIIRQASEARNGHRFRQLFYDGDTTAYDGDVSRAEFALLGHLVCWTRDAAQLERIWLRSAFGQRDKNQSRDDYRPRTIARILESPGETYRPAAGARAGRSAPPGDPPGGPHPDDPVPAESGGKKSQATQAVELIANSDAELWHSPSGDPFVTVTVEHHDEHHALGSKAFRDLVSRRYWLAEGKSIGTAALQDAINTLSGMARFAGQEYVLAGRIVHHDGAVLVDLGDANWRALRIDGAGYRVVESADVPVKFRRSRAILPLPVPEPGGSLDELRRLFAFSDDNWMLIVGWLVGCFQADGGRALLELMGQQGSGKTTLLRLLIALVDPSEVPARSMPRDEETLSIAVQNRSVLALDNVSSLTPEMSDALCRVSTGGGIGRRQLYSDSDEVLLRVQLPLAWTGIAPMTLNRPDLADRTVSVVVEPLDETQYRSERALLAEFETMRPRLVGALCSAVSSALAHRDAVHIDGLPRLADFALWVEAAAIGMGWSTGAFTDALGASRTTNSAQAVDASPIGPLIVAFANEHPHWQGSAGDLLGELRTRSDDETKRSRGFPKQPNHLSGTLRRLQPALVSMGIRVGFERSRTGSVIQIDRIDLVDRSGTAPADDRMVF